MAGDDLENTISRLLDRPIDDEKKVLELIVNAITSKYTDPSLVRRAVKQACYNYENQLRVFMVAVANAQLARIIRLINLLDNLEVKMQDPEFIQSLDPREMIKLYALQQSHLASSLEYVKKIADMRIELQTAQAAITNTLTSKEMAEINTLSGLPTLSAQQRGSVRKLVEGIMSDIATDLSSTCECEGECHCQQVIPPGKGNGERGK